MLWTPSLSWFPDLSDQLCALRATVLLVRVTATRSPSFPSIVKAIMMTTSACISLASFQEICVLNYNLLSAVSRNILAFSVSAVSLQLFLSLHLFSYRTRLQLGWIYAALMIAFIVHAVNSPFICCFICLFWLKKRKKQNKTKHFYHFLLEK